MDGSVEYLDVEDTAVKQPFVLESADDRFSRIRQCASNHINFLTEKHISPDEDDGSNDRRLIMIGMSGSGKSTIGNAILDEDEFEARPSPKLVTRQSQKGVKFRFGKNLAVIDTPGLNNMELTEKEIAIEIANCVMMSAPGPHCFLLTIPIGRTADGFNAVLSFIIDIFGEEMLRRTVVIFTRADELKHHKISIEDYINQDRDLSVIVQRCGKYMTFDPQSQILSQMKYLMDKIDELFIQHNESYYSKGYFRVPAQATENRLKRKYQRESAKCHSVVRPMVEPLFAKMLQLEQQIKNMQNENLQLQKQIDDLNKQDQSRKLSMELEKCRKEVHSLQNSLERTNTELSKSNRRHTRAISKLTMENNELKEELCKLGGFRVLPPRGSNRPHPYVYYPR